MNDRPDALEVVHIARGVRVQNTAADRHRTRLRGVEFFTPVLDVAALVWPRTVPPPALDVPLQEVIEFLVETGRRLDLEKNEHLATACANAARINHLPVDVSERLYRGLGRFFRRELVEFEVRQGLGADVDGWSEIVRPSGSIMRIRPFPIRILHFLAGNAPGLAAVTLMRSCLSRGVHLLKLPSNDLFTAPAILLTMADIDPAHPLVRSHSAAYWRGGNEAVEREIFRTELFDTVVAWGGESAIRNVQTMTGPGLDLVALNPKVSISLVGKEAFADDETLSAATRAAALDVGHQEACQDSRVQFVEGTVEEVDRYSQRLVKHLQAQASQEGGRPTPPEILQTVADREAVGDDVRTWGRPDGSGMVIRSAAPLPIYPIGRTVNVVPVRDLREATSYVDTRTQTVGVYPDTRRAAVRDAMCASGAQRIVALGASIGTEPPHGRPHDGFNVLHRMVRWVVEEERPPSATLTAMNGYRG
jgi:hypothetical protein